MTTKAARGETARRIYTVLHRNPDLTAEEIHGRLPDLTLAAIRSALYKMETRGAVEVRSVKNTNPNGRGRAANVYHVKYKSGAIKKAKPVEKAKPAEKLKTRTKPLVAEPLVAEPLVAEPLVGGSVTTMVKATPKVEIRERPAPTAEREVMMLRHIGNISDTLKNLNVNNKQTIEINHKLVELLTETLKDLAETKQALEVAEARRNWWDAVKGWFA